MNTEINMLWENDAVLRFSFIYSCMAEGDNKAMESTNPETIRLGRVCVWVCVRLGGRQEEACAHSHLTKQAIANAAGELLSLGNLVGDSFLLIQLLGKHLQLSEGELQGQTVHVAPRRVLQHVLAEVTTARVRLPGGKANTFLGV